VTAKLLASNAKPSSSSGLSELEPIRYIELFKVDPYPFFLEEEHKWRAVGQKREREPTDVKAEAALTDGLMKPGRPMPFQLSKLQAGAEGGEHSVSALFEPILSEIRDYLESLTKAEQGDDEAA
jgi:hypothetical protein